MKECLNCKNGFETKRDSAKFCSTNCRVKWHYKQEGKVKKENVVQMQVVMNTILEMVGKINYGVVPTILDAPRVSDLRRDEPPQWEEPKMQGKSVQQHHKEIGNLETPYEYEQKRGCGTKL